MATRTEPTVGETSGALFRALCSVGVEADLAYRADDEVRSQAGQNVIAVVNERFAEIGAKIDSFRAELNTKIDTVHAELGAKIDAQGARIDAVDTRIDAVNSQIDSLRSELNGRIDTLQRVIWPLVGLLATTVFGLLYRVLTAQAP